MAENSGRGNIIDAPDGPRGGDVAPPPLSPEVKSAVAKSAAGVHAAGQEPGMRPDTTTKVEPPPLPSTETGDEREDKREDAGGSERAGGGKV
ncbi:hypothetical protein F4802DRAFT_546964 [Xylaria palmicola]|nr:hypothetical protein F4802DRAFT_546964 [Xylaria palmicola]